MKPALTLFLESVGAQPTGKRAEDMKLAQPFFVKWRDNNKANKRKENDKN